MTNTTIRIIAVLAILVTLAGLGFAILKPSADPMETLPAESQEPVCTKSPASVGYIYAGEIFNYVYVDGQQILEGKIIVGEDLNARDYRYGTKEPKVFGPGMHEIYLPDGAIVKVFLDCDGKLWIKNIPSPTPTPVPLDSQLI